MRTRRYGCWNPTNYRFKREHALIERFVKRLFFAADCFSNCFLFRTDLGEDVAHRFRNHIDKLEEEWFVKPERATIADGTAQDAAQNVAATFVGRDDSVGNRKRKRADVIRDHAKSNIDLLLLVLIL